MVTANKVAELPKLHGIIKEEDGETRDFGELVSVGSVPGGANTTRLCGS